MNISFLFSGIGCLFGDKPQEQMPVLNQLAQFGKVSVELPGGDTLTVEKVEPEEEIT